MAKAESLEIRKMKRLFCERGGDVAERIGTLITEIRSIGRGSNAEGIENEENGSVFGHALRKWLSK
jgi:hypothetical protein